MFYSIIYIYIYIFDNGLEKDAKMQKIKKLLKYKSQHQYQ